MVSRRHRNGVNTACWLVGLCLSSCVVFSAEISRGLHYNPDVTYRVELPPNSPLGEASIREHTIAWHPQRRKFYLVADVVPLASARHPNTYDTELHLWSSPDLTTWTYHGVAVPKGQPGADYAGYGTASPAGMIFWQGKLYVPFSARRTPQFTQRSIGLAWSGDQPEAVPWTKSPAPISDLAGEDDDAALVSVPEDRRLHLYHRNAGPNGYLVAHTASATPESPSSWPAATGVTLRPEGVRAQELTGAFALGGSIHLFVIEQGPAFKGIRIAHLRAGKPDALFEPFNPHERYLDKQPIPLAYGGHITPVLRAGQLVALFWTAPQRGTRYGLLGHPAWVTKE